MRAATTKEEKGKLEIVNGRIYQVIARYIEVDEKPYVLELIRCLDSDWSIGEMNHERLIDIFVHYNDRLYRDAVTDAYNRRYYEDEMKNKKKNAGVALIDLDDFKLHNDIYGHQAGDMALYTVVDIILKNIRKTDKLVRFGGDEFLLVMPEVTEEIFSQKLQLIQERIYNANVPGYPNLRLSISAGGVLTEGDSIEEAVNRADKLMYQAKATKNKVVTQKDKREQYEKQIQIKQRILVVDDSEMNREILCDMLKDDYEIIEATNGQECVSLIEQYGKEISLVLLDIVMPVMDGFEILMYMNRNHWIEDVPVIMISSEESENYIRKAFKFGVSDYISRPFDSKVVYQRVFNTIKLYAKQRRLISMVSDQMHEKEKNNQMMVEVLSQIMEFRNGESGLHVVHINTLTRLLLERLVENTDAYNLTPDDCYLISTASAFHDIGKVGIDESILNKPGKLTEEEFETMKKHTLIGASMLDKLEHYKDEKMIKIAYQICRWHHERYDGKGYPDGLTGEQIPIAAQVVSVADVYDALVSKRVYKDAYSHEQAMKMILNGECGAFNPLLMEVLVEIRDKIKEEIRYEA
ncbi:diguanylate cyclase [Coprococcus comes]|uniref:diguanylate cyclase n=1 Tax=Coprococcus comes TaxID=410072 RepID=UPI001FAC7A30|nr:diguanylate cyclase [Coprococcus comes]